MSTRATSRSDSTEKTKGSEVQKTARQHEAVALLKGPATHALLYGGSRSGKTFIILYTLIVRAMKEKSRHLVLRLHFNHAKTSVWLDTLPKVLTLACPGLAVVWNHTDYYVEFPNGSQVWVGGLDDKDRTEKVLGTEYSSVFFNECSQLTYDSIQTARTRLAEKSGLVNRAYYDCNPPNRKHWTYRVFVLKQDPETGAPLARPDLYASMLMNPQDNQENLPPDYIETVLGGLSRRKQQRFLLGQWLDAEEGALWKYDDILRCSLGEVPQMDRIVISIDPPKFHGETSDEAGIGVAGRAGNRLYVFEDLSDRLSPAGWGGASVNAYKRWQADTIVGEVNNGGEMVGHTIHTVNPNVPFKVVTATRGKAVRAEPVAAIYEQHRAYHVGEFPELEAQMTTPFKELDHDDRVDWLVWAATELFPSTDEEIQQVIVYSDEQEISPY